MRVDACEIRSGINSRFSVIVYVEHGGRKKFQHTRNKAVCFAKCYEFRVRKMNKTYHRSSNATVFREHPAAVEMYGERRNRISISRKIYTCRERGSRAINSFYSKHLFAIYVLSCEHRENLFAVRRWKFRNFIQ